MSEPFNILLTSAGHRVERVRILRATLDALQLSGRIIAADITKLSAAARVADIAEVVPRCTADDFEPALLDVCRRHSVRLVIAGIDTELPMLAAARERFAAIGATVLVSAPQTIAIGGDKLRTHAWLVENGFPTVRQTSVAEALATPAAWPFPLIAKPAGGSASVGVVRVHNADELRFATRAGGFVVQTVASGDEYTVDVLVNRDGKCVSAVPRRRLEVRAGEVFKGVTARVPAVMDLAKQIAESLPGAYGPLNVQMFSDAASGSIHVIEINPRFGGGFPLAWHAGAKFPQWIIEEILDRPSTAAWDAWQDGLVMLRHYDAVFAPISDMELETRRQPGTKKSKE